ncbi:hypothetical protein E2C01_020116 [Portunus trituberculatus]|uniref:Uncharacterized protein n=1 Tax=Portunus trituberculatus TaxID=210409 RepID=A0A5B7E2A3_PORTR|nr:hypothetical protein [Portunus trituberculatus]
MPARSASAAHRCKLPLDYLFPLPVLYLAKPPRRLAPHHLSIQFPAKPPSAVLTRPLQEHLQSLQEE